MVKYANLNVLSINGCITCSWCSIPMLMVLIRMAIMMPRLKYLLSTMPHSFFLVSCQSSLHRFFGLHPIWFSALFGCFLSSSLVPCFCLSSLSVLSTASSSVSSPATQTAPTPSLSSSAAAHWGQPSPFEAAVRATGSADEAWTGLLWWGHRWPGNRKQLEVSIYRVHYNYCCLYHAHSRLPGLDTSLLSSSRLPLAFFFLSSPTRLPRPTPRNPRGLPRKLLKKATACLLALRRQWQTSWKSSS